MDELDSALQLTPEQTRYVVARARQQGVTPREVLDRLIPGQDQQASSSDASSPGPSESALDVARRYGLVGAIDGPGDLSTNPAYLEGLGREDAQTDAG